MTTLIKMLKDLEERIEPKLAKANNTLDSAYDNGSEKDISECEEAVWMLENNINSVREILRYLEDEDYTC